MLGLLGVLTIYQAHYLVVIRERSEVCRIDYSGSIVYQLQAVEFVKFDQNMTKYKQQEAGPILDKIGKYICYGCFFGFNVDLTRSIQTQMTQTNTDSVDVRYMWNYGLCRQLIAQGVDKQWLTPLIQGYVNEQRPAPHIQMVLVGRRRWRMGGTRFKARGIDDDGNVANHSELEQIVTITTEHQPPLLRGGIEVTKSSKVCSYLQVRGSMPFFWH